MKKNYIELIYIDKQNWKQGLHLFNITNQSSYVTHEFVMKRNVINLYVEQSNSTITTKSRLIKDIKSFLSKANVENITIVDFEMSLENIFKDMISLAKEYNIGIKIIDKSKYPIRSNVTLTIDLDEFDTKTEFEDIKEMLEADLENSLNNARKSKSPQHSSDLGIDIKYQTDFLKGLFKSINESYDYDDEYEIDFDTDILFYEDEIENLEEFENFLDLEEGIGSKVNDIFTTHDPKGDMTIIGYKDDITITKDFNSISINKKDVRKLIKALEVMIYE